MKTATVFGIFFFVIDCFVFVAFTGNFAEHVRNALKENGNQEKKGITATDSPATVSKRWLHQAGAFGAWQTASFH